MLPAHPSRSKNTDNGTPAKIGLDHGGMVTDHVQDDPHKDHYGESTYHSLGKVAQIHGCCSDCRYKDEIRQFHSKQGSFFVHLQHSFPKALCPYYFIFLNFWNNF